MQFKVAILVAVFGCVMLANGSSAVCQYCKFTDQLNLDASVQSLFPAVDELEQKLAKVSQCYESELAGQNVDIFDREASIKSIVEKYYQAFPEKTITQESITNLIASITEITNSCLNSESTIRLGFTQLSDMSDAEILALSGHHAPINSTKLGLGEVGLSGGDAACRKTGAAIPSNFDWRPKNVVTPVRNQAQCGSCWAFAAAESIESAYLQQGKTRDHNFELSYQQITDCSKSNGCSGGNSMTAFTYIKSHGLTSFANYPYRATDNHCDSGKASNRAASIRDFCIRSRFRYTMDFHSEALSDHDIQEALVNYGPLYILLNANPAWTRNYRGGVVTGGCTTQTNHAVQLVGYTPSAWIIRNSWGASWGNAGYFELARGKNLCGINTEVAFPLL